MNYDERAGLGSGSGYARDKGCAANRLMARIAKEQGKEPDPEECAEEGALTHEWIRLAQLKGMTTSESAELGISEEQLDNAFYLKNSAYLLELEFLGERTGVTKIEQRSWLYKGITPVRSSKPDHVCTVYDPDGADILIIDHKTGRNNPIEDDPDCSQLEEYALTEAANCQHSKGVKRVLACYNTRWHGVIRKEFYSEDLARIHRELMATIEAGQRENPPMNPGWYCRWCKGRLVCPKANHEAVSLDAVKVLIVPQPEGEAGQERIELLKRVQGYCEQALKYYTKILTQRPGCCGDWVISEGSEERTVHDIEKAYTLLVGEAGAPLSHQEFLECCKAFVGKLEKKYCSVAGKIQKHAKSDFNALLESAIVIKRKAGSLEKRRRLL